MNSFLPKKVSVSFVFRMIFRSSSNPNICNCEFMSPGVYLFIPQIFFIFYVPGTVPGAGICRWAHVLSSWSLHSSEEWWNKHLHAYVIIMCSNYNSLKCATFFFFFSLNRSYRLTSGHPSLALKGLFCLCVLPKQYFIIYKWSHWETPDNVWEFVRSWM